MRISPFASHVAETSENLENLAVLWGDTSQRLIPVLQRLGDLFFAAERYAEAEEQYWRLLEIQYGIFGDANIEVARTLSRLGELYFVQELYPVASQLYQTAFSVLEKSRAVKEPLFETLLCQLVWSARLQGSREQALEFERRLGEHRGRTQSGAQVVRMEERRTA